MNGSDDKSKLFALVVACVSLALAVYSSISASKFESRYHELLNTVSAMQETQNQMMQNWTIDNTELRTTLELDGEAIDELYSNQSIIAEKIGLLGDFEEDSTTDTESTESFQVEDVK